MLCSSYNAIGKLLMRLVNLNTPPMQICTTLGALPEEVPSHMVVHSFLMIPQRQSVPLHRHETALTDAVVLQRYIFMKLTYTEVDICFLSGFCIMSRHAYMTRRPLMLSSNLVSVDSIHWTVNDTCCTEYP